MKCLQGLSWCLFHVHTIAAASIGVWLKGYPLISGIIILYSTSETITEMSTFLSANWLQVLFHTAGIVILTLLFNATTVGLILKALGMSDISNARRLTVATAVKRTNDAKQRAISMLKSDRFLADAHWEIVEKKTLIEDPYSNNEKDFEVSTTFLCFFLHLLYT